jgi:hypothetical protein
MQQQYHPDSSLGKAKFYVEMPMINQFKSNVKIKPLLAKIEMHMLHQPDKKVIHVTQAGFNDLINALHDKSKLVNDEIEIGDYKINVFSLARNL